MADAIAKQHEVAIANRLVGFLNARLGTTYSSAEESEAPDAITHDASGRPLGIEVTCPDYSPEEAKNTWTIARGKPELSTRWVRQDESIGDRFARAPVLVNFTNALVSSAQNAIQEHCCKRYGMATYLVVDLSHAALTTADRADEVVGRLSVPECSGFVEVYVALTRNFSSDIELLAVTKSCV
jgi:hypothetical protein